MKKIITYITLGLLNCLMLPNSAHAQSRLNNKLFSIAENSSKPGWLEFRNDVELNPATLFTDYKAAFDLGNEDEMRLVKTEKDNLGFTHFRFQQYYKGYKIFGTDFIVHQNSNNILESANGKIIAGLNKKAGIVLGENDALEKGKSATGAKSFLWEDAAAENRLKTKKNNKKTSYFPKGELMWVTSPLNKTDDASLYSLCYKFEIAADTTGESKIVFVSANDGSIVKELPLEINCNTVFNPTVFNGPQTILTAVNSNNKYYLENDCSYNPTIHVMDANVSQTQNYLTEIVSGSGTILFDGQTKIAGVQVFWGLREAQRYYSLEHNRDSYDDDGADIEGQIKALYKTNGILHGRNANWSPSLEVFRFGYGNSTSTNADDFIALDIVAHEFTHAVTQYTADLVYAGESGALNESFSDIFGEVIENYATGTNDWLVSAEIGALRSFANPDSFSDPISYYGANWATTNCGTPASSNDYCGVHTNSGVQNRMFFLLCQGGSAPVGGKITTVVGIGIEDAASIAYRALTVYLTSTSNYYDSREAWIRAAKDLFGSCSNQAIQTGNAWYAVQVGQSLNEYNMNQCGYLPPIGAFWDVEYNGINSIVASPVHCNNIIMPAAVAVTYKAAKFVQLLPGFNAQAGCHFNAKIVACAVTNYKTIWNQNSGAIESNSEAKLKPLVQDQLNVTAAPNPFTDELNVQLNLNEGSEVTIQLYDIVGKETNVPTIINNFDSGANTITMSTSELPPGIYLLRIKCNGLTKTIKVVK